MQKIEFFDTLVINPGIENEDGIDKIFLSDSKNIQDIVYNNSSLYHLYELDDNGIMDNAAEVLTIDKFDDLYEEYKEEYHKGRETYMFENYLDEEPKPYVQARLENFPIHKQLISEHGTKKTAYDISDGTILHGTCYRANTCVLRNYPYHEHKEFYKFVADDGYTFYIKMIFPFYPNESDYAFELIYKDEFEEFD